MHQSQIMNILIKISFRLISVLKLSNNHVMNVLEYISTFVRNIQNLIY